MRYEEFFKEHETIPGQVTLKERRKKLADPRVLEAHMARWAENIARSKPIYNQAHKIIAKFGGGIVPISMVTNQHPDLLIKHVFGVNKDGTLRTFKRGEPRFTGMFTYKRLTQLIHAARYFGVMLTADDIYPGFFKIDRDVALVQRNKIVEEWINAMPCSRQNKFEQSVAEAVHDR